MTDERGAYRITVRPGVFRITAELPGFATVTRSGVELLVGQQAVANLQLAPSSVQESVTVTGEAPLINVTSSSLGGNIDPRQVSEIPVNGRNWQDLAMLAPGARANAMTDGKPTQGGGTASGNRRDFQINMDGQQVSQNLAVGIGGKPAVQPRCDRGVPVRVEPVRRHAGPVERRAGERHHQVGHEHVLGQRSPAISATTLQRRRLHRRTRCCRIRTSR